MVYLDLNLQPLTQPHYNMRPTYKYPVRDCHSHIVTSQDTVTAIACKYHCGNSAYWTDIMDQNKLDDPEDLVVGEKLLIPSYEVVVLYHG